jgi:(p)ppGpp synthase/HD superfamily hydrolase
LENQLSSRYEKALVYAFRLHQSQKRKGSGTPYFAHLIGVSSLVLEHGGSEDQAIAALLHDAVEDQGGKVVLCRIRESFGECVACIVGACSDSDTKPKPPWIDRKKQYLEHLPKTPHEALLVSLADKCYNATTILWDLKDKNKDVWTRFNASPKEILWYYEELDKIFGKIYNVQLARDFHMIVKNIKQLTRLPFEEVSSKGG